MKSRHMSKKLKVIVMPMIYIQPTTIHILQMFKNYIQEPSNNQNPTNDRLKSTSQIKAFQELQCIPNSAALIAATFAASTLLPLSKPLVLTAPKPGFVS